ncbi:signal recognition particle-docking protein FtsY [Psychrobacter phenylpyruvicus]|uniref:Signal recognition particle receptor FtsY n=1 Tax=Psychrobacter phenylpyruvicus TaxID=29432 RepID=A0A379LJ46_9GAMM|nr:signal recognition particle-docking protein FtsY [Psychrobacter phenylpyruvicus]SUD90629.1 Cell division protein FtsY [Psychrobacter phenylpyruvicus]
MNNANNPTRVVIDLDGSLDELDDDDITLPDLASTQDIPIIETPRVEQPYSEEEEVIPALSTEPKPQPTTPAVTPTPTEATRPQATELQQATEESESKKKGSWFSRMKSGLTKSRKNLAEGVANILIGGKEIDDELLEEVEDQLLVADIGVEATDKIIKSLTEQTARGDLIYSHSLYKALQKELVEILEPKVAPLVIDTTKKPFVILVVGVNGVGKTTTIGKLAKRLQAEGKSVMLAAGDTFRAAATEQLQVWGERNNIPVVAQGHGADSASVVFDAMQSAKAKNIDVLIADTAGRLQNKTHLMAELEKVVRIMRKSDPTAPHEGMIVLDAGTGQNAINQVKLFNEVVPLTGITITKLDGTAKGGVVFNIANTTDIPIRYIGVGESIDDLRAFSPKQFVAALFETDE